MELYKIDKGGAYDFVCQHLRSLPNLRVFHEGETFILYNDRFGIMFNIYGHCLDVSIYDRNIHKTQFEICGVDLSFGKMIYYIYDLRHGMSGRIFSRFRDDIDIGCYNHKYITRYYLRVFKASVDNYKKMTKEW